MTDCKACDGTGMEFAGDVHIGDCSHCGGSGTDDFDESEYYDDFADYGNW